MSESRNPILRDPVIPDKLYFRIGEVARLLDVETHTLRFWESEFPQLKVGKGGTGQRLYRRRDVELVLEIKHLLYQEGYTIPGARQHLQSRQRRREAGTSAGTLHHGAPGQAGPSDHRGEARPPSFEDIRAELRNLSAMLDKAEPNDRQGSRESEEEPQRATGRGSARESGRGAVGGPNRPRSPVSSRRGLHLAVPSPPKQAPSRDSRRQERPETPGLFGPDPD